MPTAGAGERRPRWADKREVGSSTLPRPINDLGPLGFAQEGLSIAVFRYASTRPISARQCPHRLAWMLGPLRGRVVVTSCKDPLTRGILLAAGLRRLRDEHS